MTCFLLEPALTAPSRTPWGGERIAALKGLPSGDKIGESWEFSFEPQMPSRVVGGQTLAELTAEHPQLLGAEAARGGSALLVKLLDAATALSVQIHPADDHPGLAPDESGKPESWYVIAAEPGAGIYFGLAPDASPERMAHALRVGDDVSALLGFVEVQPGDFFLVEAGTAHAVGPGVTLVEPQVVIPGRKGVTYRYWDWNRRYDDKGRQDPSGQPRALHVEQALAVTDWSGPRGAELLRGARARAGLIALDESPRWTRLASSQAPVTSGLRSSSLDVWRLCGTGDTELGAHPCMRSLTVLEGELRIGEARVGRGHSAALAAGPQTLPAQLAGAHVILAAAALPQI